MQLSCKKGIILKKLILGSLILSSTIYASTTLNYAYAIKDFNNSMTKKSGAKIHNFSILHNFKNHSFNLGYQSDRVKREHSIKKITLPSLDIEKYNLKYLYKLNENIKLKTSYLKIIDNLAPTDQGKIYGLGGSYNFTKALSLKADIYNSDYEKFDVRQYDLAIQKAFKIDNTKLKIIGFVKKIDIHGDKYASYTFKKKDYLTKGIKLVANHQGYIGSVATFFGKRAFTVLDDGTKVQHHAMEQDKTYILSVGKKFKEFDIFLKYSFQNGKELPENKEDVDTKVMSIAFSYRF